MSKVLIVDDVPDSSEPLAKFLKRGGHDVRCAPNGREALADIIRYTPEVVILDLMMPGRTVAARNPPNVPPSANPARRGPDRDSG
jgi:DNA-binding response OmpR family regulator